MVLEKLIDRHLAVTATTDTQWVSSQTKNAWDNAMQLLMNALSEQKIALEDLAKSQLKAGETAMHAGKEVIEHMYELVKKTMNSQHTQSCYGSTGKYVHVSAWKTQGTTATEPHCACICVHFDHEKEKYVCNVFSFRTDLWPLFQESLQKKTDRVQLDISCFTGN